MEGWEAGCIVEEEEPATAFVEENAACRIDLVTEKAPWIRHRTGPGLTTIQLLGGLFWQYRLEHFVYISDTRNLERYQGSLRVMRRYNIYI